MDQWPQGEPEGHPWDQFIAARQAVSASDTGRAISIWRDIATTPELESRHYLQAWTFLRGVGQQPDESEAATVYGVMIEMPVQTGHDVLVAYADGRSRYLNHAGRVSVIEDLANESIQSAARAWLEVGRALVAMIGPWEPAELPALPAGHMRIMILTPAGPRFGQGPEQQMLNEAPVKPFFQAATALLQAIVDQST